MARSLNVFLAMSQREEGGHDDRSQAPGQNPWPQTCPTRPSDLLLFQNHGSFTVRPPPFRTRHCQKGTLTRRNRKRLPNRKCGGIFVQKKHEWQIFFQQSSQRTRRFHLHPVGAARKLACLLNLRVEARLFPLELVLVPMDLRSIGEKGIKSPDSQADGRFDDLFEPFPFEESDGHVKDPSFSGAVSPSVGRRRQRDDQGNERRDHPEIDLIRAFGPDKSEGISGCRPKAFCEMTGEHGAGMKNKTGRVILNAIGPGNPEKGRSAYVRPPEE